MNKKFLLIALLSAYCGFVSAQSQPPRRLGSTYHTNNDTTILMDIRERLVQLAMQNPNFEVADRRVSVAHYQLNRAKGEWLSVVVPSINLNPLTIAPKSDGNQFLPLWNVGVAIPLNFYTQRTNEVKIARENIYIAEAEKNERYRDVRLKVLTRYEDYLMYKEMYDLQSRVTADTYLVFRQSETDFADGLIGVDIYNKAFAAYKQQQDGKLKAGRDLKVAELELEYMIGITINEALGKK
ncbi:MAG: TolC family protein [Chitinophagaceae bacterium]|nr:TolC family protein [Chitinophagaceae bacterium]